MPNMMLAKKKIYDFIHDAFDRNNSDSNPTLLADWKQYQDCIVVLIDGDEYTIKVTKDRKITPPGA